MNNKLPFWFAIIIFFGFMIFIIIFAFVPVGDVDIIKIILTAFITWMGAIIGFYFGEKPVQELRDDLKKSTNENANLKRDRKEDTADLADALKKFQNLEIRAEQLKNLVNESTEGVDKKKVNELKKSMEQSDLELSDAKELIKKIDIKIKSRKLE